MTIGITVGLHHHVANPYHESRTGPDHIALGVATRDDLVPWAAWLDELGVAHSGVIDTENPMPYPVVVSRNPVDIQLELFHMDG